jgi:NTP pyrophosphatase (non-canonical NTP hydrolase)
MKKTKNLYYIYHIPGKKIGVTRNINKRVTIQQGYQESEYEVLESSNDIDYISNRELELQLIYGYKIDRETYKQLFNKMVVNVTEQTTTFPCPLNKLKGNLMDNKGMKIETNFGKYVLTDDLADWIVKNASTSMYNPARSYVYNKAMDEFTQSLGKKSMALDYYNQPEEVKVTNPNVYDLIRLWADERGIYRNGDSKTQYTKLCEESGELARAILKKDKPELIDAIGDMVVVLTNLAALEGLKIEDCVQSAYNVIKSRQGSMINGTFVKSNMILPISGGVTSVTAPSLGNHIKTTL